MGRSVTERFQPIAFTLLRILVGFTFMPHGAQKLFGWFRDTPRTVELFSILGLAGTIEFFGGLLILAGLFTRPVAFVAAGEMAVAVFWRHLPRGFWPILNGGELAVLYCFVFLTIWAHGPGPYSLDALIWRRRSTAAGTVEPRGQADAAALDAET